MPPNPYGLHHTFFSVQIDRPTLVGNQTYVPKPPLMEITRSLWYCNALISYSIAGTELALMGRLPRFIRKSDFLDKIFPSYHGWEPMVFYDQPADFHFVENKIYFSPPLEAPDFNLSDKGLRCFHLRSIWLDYICCCL